MKKDVYNAYILAISVKNSPAKPWHKKYLQYSVKLNMPDFAAAYIQHNWL